MSFSEQRDQFLVLLDEVGNVGIAARELGINRNTAYGWAASGEAIGAAASTGSASG